MNEANDLRTFLGRLFQFERCLDLYHDQTNNSFMRAETSYGSGQQIGLILLDTSILLLTYDNKSQRLLHYYEVPFSNLKRWEFSKDESRGLHFDVVIHYDISEDGQFIDHSSSFTLYNDTVHPKAKCNNQEVRTTYYLDTLNNVIQAYIDPLLDDLEKNYKSTSMSEKAYNEKQNQLASKLFPREVIDQLS